MIKIFEILKEIKIIVTKFSVIVTSPMNHPLKKISYSRDRIVNFLSFSSLFYQPQKPIKNNNTLNFPFVVFALIFINAPLRHNGFVKSAGEMEALPCTTCWAHCKSGAERRKEWKMGSMHSGELDFGCNWGWGGVVWNLIEVISDVARHSNRKTSSTT